MTSAIPVQRSNQLSYQANWELSTGSCQLRAVNWELSTGSCQLGAANWDQLSVGLIAQLVTERCTGIAEVMGSNPAQA